MAPSRHNFWYGKEPSSRINIECLLPNGICISFPLIQADTRISKIKSELWNEAARYTLSNRLKAKEQYVFVVVSSKGGTEELVDEELSLFDVKPVRPYLKAVLKEGDEEKKRIASKISMLIGRSLAGSAKSEEVDEFRRTYTASCEDVSRMRGRSSWAERAIYTYPPEFEDDEVIPEKIIERLRQQGNKIHITVTLKKNFQQTFEIPSNCYPKDLVDLALKKRAPLLRLQDMGNSGDYVLKVIGKENYLLGYMANSNEDTGKVYMEKPLLQYKYIRECLQWDKKIRLRLVEKSALDVEPLIGGSTIGEAPPPLPPKLAEKNEISLWNLSSGTMFKFKVVCALNITAGTMLKEVICGIFHGGEQVCKLQTTSQKEGLHPCWNEWLEFDLATCDLPRMARLCFAIAGYKANDVRRKKPTPIAWVNVPVFDYKGLLRMGQIRLQCWTYTSKMSSDTSNIAGGLINPLGTVSSSGNESGPCLLIDFVKFVHTVAYPSDDIVLELASSVAGRDPSCHPFLMRGSKVHREQIEAVIAKDTLAPLLEQEKELLWLLRAECCHDFPQSLPKLLQCVKWNSREDVAQMYFLLQAWRKEPLEIGIALDLLDYKFPDIKVRKLAVQVLDGLSDGELELYLLQLVQALKYEVYLDSPLAKYLLRRALNNRRIGHFLFWHLKADIHNPEVSLQFGLLLEMYCRGSVGHIDSLLRQSEAISKMKTVTEILRQNKRDQDPSAKLSLMRECFAQPTYAKAFSDLCCPLDPSVYLKQLRVDKCKYMNSAKKPLWLVFENADEEGDFVCIIFKNGDDLRQDMLTLQTLRLMDQVWKQQGLDMRIIPYRCLSTSDMMGLIEVVRDSETLGRIQADRGAVRGVFKEDTLHMYMSKYWQNDEEKRKCYIDDFVRSVAGYSVATYVLGIGDRHNDNIMLKYDTGQLFHIDFGHFLGNFKSKFGIKRERVKFVLPRDFIYIIEKGIDGSSKEKNFEKFRQMCIDAFSALRCKGNLFIALFAMLLSTGIPELEHPNDLDYIRDSLALAKSEEDAVKHFEASFKEALEKEFSTTMMFFIHNIRHYWVG